MISLGQLLERGVNHREKLSLGGTKISQGRGPRGGVGEGEKPLMSGQEGNKRPCKAQMAQRPLGQLQLTDSGREGC